MSEPLPTARREPAGALPAFELPESSVIESASPADQFVIPQQLKALPALLGKAFQVSQSIFSSTDGSPIQEFDVARLFLFSSTLMARRHTSETLGTHEINLLYKNRDRLETASSEQHQLFRTIVGGSGDVKPGWYWFRDTSEEAVAKALVALVSQDSSEGVQVAALDLLSAARMKIPLDLWPALPFYHNSLMVRQSAFSYLATNGDETTLSFLEQLATDGDPLAASETKDARLQILIRLDPSRAFFEVIAKDEYLSYDTLRSLLARISEVNEQAR